MESLYEYGTRVGVWRLRRLFETYRVAGHGVRRGHGRGALPDPVQALPRDGHEICSHGYRWIDYQYVDEATERDHVRPPLPPSSRPSGSGPRLVHRAQRPNTRRLVVEEGGFVYDADDYNDELPYWNRDFGRPHLVIPYTLDVNDMRFATPQGFNSGEQFHAYLKDSFDVLYPRAAERPRMLSVGLHCRLRDAPGHCRAGTFHPLCAARTDRDVGGPIDHREHWLTQHPAGAGPEMVRSRAR